MNAPLLKGAPVTAAECDGDWIRDRREVIRRDGYALRAGTAEAGPTIEIKSLTTNEWLFLMLPNEATCFVAAVDRDAVLDLLWASRLSALSSPL